MNGEAFGLRVDDIPTMTPEQAHAQRQWMLHMMSRVRGNRHQRRHPVAYDPARPNARRPLTPKQRARRAARNHMAKMSRRANR